MNSFKLLLFFCFSIFTIHSCSKKATVVKEVPIPLEIAEEEPIIVNPNCANFYTISDEEREIAETAYVLYRDQIKLGNYKNALPLWKKAFYIAPCANGRVKYQYDDGIKIYRNFYTNETNETLKRKYVDTIMSIYDRRLECIMDTSYVLGKKAYDYYYYFQGIKSKSEIFDLMSQAMDGKPNKADYFILNPMSSLLIEQYQTEKTDKATAKKYAYQILHSVDYGLENCSKKNCERWKTLAEYAPVRLEAFEGLKDFYECEYYVNLYYNSFQENPTDCDIINETYRKLKRGNCDEDGAIFKEVEAAKKEHCKVVVAQAGPCKSGYISYNDGQYKEAIESFKACIISLEDADIKAKYSLLIAKIYYRDLKQFPKARKYALEAAKLKSNWGEPFMLIGRLYASSGPLCGPGRGWDSQVVTWPAIDKWNHAKRIDPSVSAEANKLINTYKKYMPSKEDLHQRTIKIGSTFKVKCWINESTIVRAAE